ncbi:MULTISPECIES: hypothetical protein [Chryseobacterium]|uniref:hypothetical protein n=1 Tax=Chryseobacterium TaxID=59732 RepID=UPI00195BE1CE|nr:MULTISPECIES: hypothetical protein [Chryseobacterium]MBM7419622.1 hypothetical protein [Chryseobacterium sp. JUb44]MDH6209553.1 hypothetical protein [Chryseobacterium sp. BIGb0186]WSO08315.1 hypothetical protein VUJ64_10775 [Chryseobacterium scophthalmum]
MQNRINLVKEDKYSGLNGGTFTNSINDFIPQFSKILNKESNYRNLITQENYILVIRIDVINLQKEFITDTDLRDFLNFNSQYSLIRNHNEFCENVAGIIGKPIFPKNVFIENEYSLYQLNKLNLNILKKI